MSNTTRRHSVVKWLQRQGPFWVWSRGISEG